MKQESRDYMGKPYYQIGEFSKLCHLPIRTLHYYNEIGLLIPDKVDPDNHYRYYSEQQILEASIIQFYKEAGFELMDIKNLIKRDRLEFNQSMITKRCQEIDEKIAELMVLRKRLSHFTTYEQKESKEKQEVVFKKIPFCYVAYERYVGSSRPDGFMIRYSRLHDLIKRRSLHMCSYIMAIYYDDYHTYDYDHADIEVCAPVLDEVAEDNSEVRLFGGFYAAVATHYGPYNQMPATYQRMLDAIEEKGYIYPNRGAVESYIIDCMSTRFESQYVTEIILPIQKK